MKHQLEPTSGTDVCSGGASAPGRLHGSVSCDDELVRSDTHLDNCCGPRLAAITLLEILFEASCAIYKRHIFGHKSRAAMLKRKQPVIHG